LDTEKAQRLSEYLAECSLDANAGGFPLHDKRVDIEIHMGSGRGEAELLGSDLSYGYIEENAEYTS
jgi:N-acetylglutamate synthase/N-acetylornithine aminotransferase